VIACGLAVGLLVIAWSLLEHGAIGRAIEGAVR
jgi:hypothetical protein